MWVTIVVGVFLRTGTGSFSRPADISTTVNPILFGKASARSSQWHHALWRWHPPPFFEDIGWQKPTATEDPDDYRICLALERKSWPESRSSRRGLGGRYNTTIRQNFLAEAHHGHVIITCFPAIRRYVDRANGRPLIKHDLLFCTIGRVETITEGCPQPSRGRGGEIPSCTSASNRTKLASVSPARARRTTPSHPHARS